MIEFDILHYITYNKINSINICRMRYTSNESIP